MAEYRGELVESFTEVEPNNRTRQNWPKISAAPLVIAAALVVAAAPLVALEGVRCIGFGENGIKSGSLAARLMHFYGGAVPRGSFFSTLQKLGASGFATSTYAAAVAVGAGVAAIGMVLLRRQRQLAEMTWTRVSTNNSSSVVIVEEPDESKALLGPA